MFGPRTRRHRFPCKMSMTLVGAFETCNQANLEEKSENLRVEGPYHVDGQGTMSGVVTGEDSDTIPKSKKKKMKKKQKPSKSTRREDMVEQSLVDDVTVETSDEVTSTSKKPKAQGKKKKKKDSIQDNEDRKQNRKAKKKKTPKKVKKAQESSRGMSDAENCCSEVLRLDLVQDSSRQVVPTFSNFVNETSDFPPDLHSDTSSSDLPEPTEIDECIDYESDSSLWPVEHYDRQDLTMNCIDDTHESIRDHDDIEVGSIPASVASLSQPPQHIPGSLAKEVVGDQSCQQTDVEVTRNTSRLTGNGWKSRAIAGIGFVLVVTIIVIVAL